MSDLTPAPTGTRERGWALVSVLWVVVILAMMAAATQALTVTSARIEQHAAERAHADAALDAGVVRAVLGITMPDISARWPVDGTPRRFTFAGYTMRIAVQDEFGRIDLNAADESVLRQLLSDAGLKTEEAAALTDKILDWRSATPLHRLHGATDADYATAGYGYRQRHGPFRTVDELKLVMGMTPALFAKIRPALTIYSRRPTIDQNVAPREALLAYYAGDTATVDRTLAARRTSEPPPDRPDAPPAGLLDTQVSLAGRTFTVTVELQNGRQHFVREAVIMLTNDDERPYLVMAWR